MGQDAGWTARHDPEEFERIQTLGEEEAPEEEGETRGSRLVNRIVWGKNYPRQFQDGKRNTPKKREKRIPFQTKERGGDF